MAKNIRIIISSQVENKVLTQFLARLRCETGIRGRNFGTVGVQLFQAGL